MTEIASEVIGLLKSYQTMKRWTEQLRYELGSSGIISEKELIECMALGSHTEGQGYRNNHLSDRTMAIALSYKDDIDRMRHGTHIDIIKELFSIEKEIERLEYYVSLLGENEATVVRLLYFERRTWDEAEKALNVSNRTIFNYRKRAIKGLVSMYSLLREGKITGENGKNIPENLTE